MSLISLNGTSPAGKIILATNENIYTAEKIAEIRNAFSGKRIIVFDFDGVCHDEYQYDSASEKIVPFPDVLDAILALKDSGYCLVLWTSRAHGYTETTSGRSFVANFLRQYGIFDCFDMIITGENTSVPIGKNITTTSLQINDILENKRDIINTSDKNIDLLFPDGAVLIDNKPTFRYGQWQPGQSGKYQIIIAGSDIISYFSDDPEGQHYQRNIPYLAEFSHPTASTLIKAIKERFELMGE